MFAPLLEPARFKGAHGGRGSGKSHNFGEMMIEDCIFTHIRAVCIREVQVSIKQSVKLLLADKIKSLGLRSYFDIQETIIRGPNESFITFQGMQGQTEESIKSLEGYNRAYVTEAQNFSASSLEILTPTIRAPGAELWFDWNPKKPTDPVDKFFRGKDKPPSSICVEANWQDNPWFPDGLRLEKDWDFRRDPEKYAHVWGGKYKKITGAVVFKNWRIADKPLQPRSGTVFRFGADWGFATDPTVLICGYIEGRTLYVWREKYAVGVEVDHTPQLFDELDAERPQFARKWRIIADSARPETISYMRRHNYPRIVHARKGAGSVHEGIEFLKSYDIVVDPSCKHTIDELTDYSFKIDKLTGEPVPILEDKKNHVIDSLRYMVEDVRKPKAKLV